MCRICVDAIGDGVGEEVAEGVERVNGVEEEKGLVGQERMGDKLADGVGRIEGGSVEGVEAVGGGGGEGVGTSSGGGGGSRSGEVGGRVTSATGASHRATLLGTARVRCVHIRHRMQPS